MLTSKPTLIQFEWKVHPTSIVLQSELYFQKLTFHSVKKSDWTLMKNSHIVNYWIIVWSKWITSNVEYNSILNCSLFLLHDNIGPMYQIAGMRMSYLFSNPTKCCCFGFDFCHLTCRSLMMLSKSQLINISKSLNSKVTLALKSKYGINLADSERCHSAKWQNRSW